MSNHYDLVKNCPKIRTKKSSTDIGLKFSTGDYFRWRSNNLYINFFLSLNKLTKKKLNYSEPHLYITEKVTYSAFHGEIASYFYPSVFENRNLSTNVGIPKAKEIQS